MVMDAAGKAESSPQMGIFLAAAMFVFVIDTSFMNVSISAVVHDLDTTVSGVQAAVAIEALVSAAFILISSKLGDLFGRKRAYIVGLVFYAVGAIAMVFAQGLTAIIVFWAVVGGLGASLYLPAMQSLIHGNFRGQGAREGLRAGRCGGRNRGRDRTADRGLRDDRPFVACRVRARSSDHRDCSVREQADP
jgi:MFS family permease